MHRTVTTPSICRAAPACCASTSIPRCLHTAPIPPASIPSTSTSRRQLLLSSIASSAALLGLQQPASAADPAQLVTAPIRPALSYDQYLGRIAATRGQAFRELGLLIDRYKFKECAEALIIYPFDEVAQSAFYLPWAMLAKDEERAVKVQTAYVDFQGTLYAFEAICRRAARYRADEEEVIEALFAMNAALDRLVASAA